MHRHHLKQWCFYLCSRLYARVACTFVITDKTRKRKKKKKSRFEKFNAVRVKRTGGRPLELSTIPVQRDGNRKFDRLFLTRLGFSTGYYSHLLDPTGTRNENKNRTITMERRDVSRAFASRAKSRRSHTVRRRLQIRDATPSRRRRNTQSRSRGIRSRPPAQGSRRRPEVYTVRVVQCYGRVQRGPRLPRRTCAERRLLDAWQRLRIHHATEINYITPCLWCDVLYCIVAYTAACEIYDLCFRSARGRHAVVLNTRTAKACDRVRIDTRIIYYNIICVCVCTFVRYSVDSHCLVVSAVRNAST